MKENRWARLLAYVTGMINQELLLKNEYLAAENRILRAHLPSRLRLSDPERSTLAEIGKRVHGELIALQPPVGCTLPYDSFSKEIWLKEDTRWQHLPSRLPSTFRYCWYRTVIC